MTLDLEVNGRRRTIVLDPVPGTRDLRVTLDGRTFDVDAARVGVSGFSLIVSGDGGTPPVRPALAEGEGRVSHYASVVERAPGELEIHVRGHRVIARLNSGRTRYAAGAGDVAQAGAQRVLAPMPGKVVRVLVAPGDTVTAGQGLVIVEAMKMENELRSPKAGRVREVAASDGMPVEAGRVLVVIE